MSAFAAWCARAGLTHGCVLGPFRVEHDEVVLPEPLEKLAARLLDHLGALQNLAAERSPSIAVKIRSCAASMKSARSGYMWLGLMSTAETPRGARSLTVSVHGSRTGTKPARRRPRM